MRPGGIIPVYHVYCTQFELWLESCFYLMYLFESTTACCEAGVEIVAMTTVANNLQVTTDCLLQYRHYHIKVYCCQLLL